MKLLLSATLLMLCLCARLALAQTAKPAEFKPWKIPHDALFFKEKATDDWNKLPETEREWIAPGGLTPDVFKALDMHNTGLAMRRGGFEPLTASNEEKRVQAAALGTLKAAIRFEWIPPVALLTPGRMHPTEPRPSYEIAFSSFERQGVRALVWLSVDREIWIYLEQPVAVAKTALVRPADVLRPELFADSIVSRPAFTAREFTRTRAFLPNGDYQPVRILLIHCQLPQSLGFSDFAYPGTVTP